MKREQFRVLTPLPFASVADRSDHDEAEGDERDGDEAIEHQPRPKRRLADGHRPQNLEDDDDHHGRDDGQQTQAAQCH